MASRISTRFLSSDPNRLRDELILLLQEKRAGKKSNVFDEETFAIVAELLDFKCISTIQHNFLPGKCLN